MTRIRNRGEAPKKSPLSFIVPFVIALIFIVIIVKYLFAWSSTSENRGGSFVTVAPKQEQSEIYIYMSGDAKKKLDGATKMYSTDNKLSVTSGEAEVSLDGNSSKIYADKGAEVKYEGATAGGKQTFSLQNAYIWVEAADQNLDIKLKSFKVNPNAGSIVILSQNAIASNVYVLKGSASIETIASVPRTTNVGVGQQLTVLKNEVEATSFQVADKIEPISDFIKTVELFIKHNGDSLLASSVESGSGEVSSTGSTNWSGSIKSGKSAILITYPEDESTVDTSIINVEGNVIGSSVDKITINDREASYDKEKKSFVLKDLTLSSSTNNIVYKVFDEEGGLIHKGILTVYSSKKTAQEDEKKPSVTTYPISDKQFQILSPTENPYKTSDDVVRIEGRVVKGTVKYITINDFRLSKFPQLGSSWYYFANKDYGTMNDGINLYTIKYYGLNDELLFTNLFTIVKEGKKPVTETDSVNAGSGTEAPAVNQ